MIEMIRYLDEVSKEQIEDEKILTPLCHARYFVFRIIPCPECGDDHEALLTLTIGLN